jgi:hypothetical protein
MRRFPSSSLIIAPLQPEKEDIKAGPCTIMYPVFSQGELSVFPEVVDCAVEDRDREIENSKVCARTRDTRFI